MGSSRVVAVALRLSRGVRRARTTNAALASMLLAALAGCPAEDNALLVDLKTDLVPGVEFHSVRTELTSAVEDAGSTRPYVALHEAPVGGMFVEGVRVAELRGLPKSVMNLRVALLDREGDRVTERQAIVSVSGVTGATVIITRDCLSVTCPPEGEPTLTTCESGRCISPECTPETPDRCGEIRCARDADCGGGTGCIRALCESGACLLAPVDALCADDERCDPIASCVANVVCGDGRCTGDESTCTCPDDCGGACGDGCCNAGETPCTCGDCPPQCGDGCCNGGDNTCNCPQDCGGACGDGCCNAGENTCNCPNDCGGACGDGCCNAGESTCSCPNDCGSACGDGCCNGGESCLSCAGDCGGGDCICYVRCCDGVLHDQVVNSDADCRELYGFCIGSGTYTWRMERGGRCVYQRDTACPGGCSGRYCESGRTCATHP